MEGQVRLWKPNQNGNVSAMEMLETFRKESLHLEEEKREKARVDQLIANVPYRFRNKSFDDFRAKCESQTRVKGLGFRYVDTFKDRLNDGVNLIFCGKPGTGKTYLSLIMFQQIVKAGFSARYESSLCFLQDLLETKFRAKSEFESFLDRIIKIDFLILDEVTESINANGRPSEIEKNLLFRIINSRYEDKRATLIISNRDESGIVDRLGNPIFRRLKEGGLVMAFNWESFSN